MADFTGNLDMLLDRQRMEQETEPIRIDRTQSVRSKEKYSSKSKGQPAIAEEQDGIVYGKTGKSIKSVSSSEFNYFKLNAVVNKLNALFYMKKNL